MLLSGSLYRDATYIYRFPDPIETRVLILRPTKCETRQEFPQKKYRILSRQIYTVVAYIIFRITFFGLEFTVENGTHNTITNRSVYVFNCILFQLKLENSKNCKLIKTIRKTPNNYFRAVPNSR